MSSRAESGDQGRFRSRIAQARGSFEEPEWEEPGLGPGRTQEDLGGSSRRGPRESSTRSDDLSSGRSAAAESTVLDPATTIRMRTPVRTACRRREWLAGDCLPSRQGVERIAANSRFSRPTPKMQERPEATPTPNGVAGRDWFASPSPRRMPRPPVDGLGIVPGFRDSARAGRQRSRTRHQKLPASRRREIGRGRLKKGRGWSGEGRGTPTRWWSPDPDASLPDRPIARLAPARLERNPPCPVPKPMLPRRDVGRYGSNGLKEAVIAPRSTPPPPQVGAPGSRLVLAPDRGDGVDPARSVLRLR